MSDPVEGLLASVRRAVEMWRPQIEQGLLTGFHVEAELNEFGRWDMRGGPIHNQRVYSKLAKRNGNHIE